jgi:uncharacterized protein YijF (DUF1287 family)
MQGMAPSYFMIKILKKYSPYDAEGIKDLHMKMQREFGTYGRSWGFKSPALDDPLIYNDTNAWVLEYWFRDHNTALIFSLKYLE